MSSDEKIGQILVRMGLISEVDLEHAIRQQLESKQKGGHVFKVGEILLFQKKISLQQLQGALYQQKSRADESRNFIKKVKSREVGKEQDRLARKKGKDMLEDDSSMMRSFISIFKRKKK